MKHLIAIPSVFALLLFSSCSSDPYVARGQAGGAAIGGLAGGLISDSWGGAAVGAALGGLIGGETRR
jgi:hypothetical protein